MNRRLLAAVLVVAIAAGGFWYWTTTPQYAVQQASESIKVHDVDRFHNWVNVRSLSSAAVDDLLSEPIRSSGVGVLERVVGFALVSFMKPTMTEKTSEQIDKWVAHKPKAEGGSDEEDAAPPKTILGAITSMVKPPSLRELFQDYGLTKENYRGMGATDINGNLSHVGLRFFSPKAQREVEIKLELQNGSGHWQVTRVSNFQQVLPVLAGAS